MFYEHVTLGARGSQAQPITIRGYPGELAVIDGGLREFFEHPAKAWRPCAAGVEGEFESAKTYPNLAAQPSGTQVMGNFGDSLIPLHGYRFLADLRSANEYFAKLGAAKSEAGAGVYCGPGVFYNSDTQRVHVRLAHTDQAALGADNYRGETDPRRLPLVIAGSAAGPALALQGARYVRLQDFVVRGARSATLSVQDSANIELDGLTVYGGSSVVAARDTHGLRLWNVACRGVAAPWTYRGSLKYRGIETRIFNGSGWSPTGNDNSDFELAYSEFTDSVDGVFIGNVKRVKFHHNLLDNVSDDGMFLTATTAYDGAAPGGDVQIYQNLLSRCLTTFAFGVGHGRQKMTPRGRQTGAGVFIYRNVFDFRRPVMYQQPAEGQREITTYGRVAGDHGGPAWEPMTIYHNTVISRDPPFRGYYAAGFGGHLSGGARREVFNNAFVQIVGKPGGVLPPVIPPAGKNAARANKPKPNQPKADPLADLIDAPVDAKPKISSPRADLAELDKPGSAKPPTARPSAPLPVYFQADGNLHHSDGEPVTAEALFGRFRRSPDFEASKRLYAAGWTSHDLVADPKFTRFATAWRDSLDLSLSADSQALDAGVALAKAWPDPLRENDRGRPDIGALPYGARPARVGVSGRLTLFGAPVAGGPNSDPAAKGPLAMVPDAQIPSFSRQQAALIIEGYPAFDAPLLRFALLRLRVPCRSVQRTWVDLAEYAKFQLVVVTGSLPRAKIAPSVFSEADLQALGHFLRGGGALLLTRGNASLFATPAGRAWLAKITGASNGAASRFEVLQPKHPWVKHLLDAKSAPVWVNAKSAQPLRASAGETIIGTNNGQATLYRVAVGRGQLIYVGWDIAASLPAGRRPSTVEQETAFEQQMQTLQNIVESVVAKRGS